jgi:hypothetical protein
MGHRRSFKTENRQNPAEFQVKKKKISLYILNNVILVALIFLLSIAASFRRLRMLRFECCPTYPSQALPSLNASGYVVTATEIFCPARQRGDLLLTTLKRK